LEGEQSADLQKRHDMVAIWEAEGEQAEKARYLLSVALKSFTGEVLDKVVYNIRDKFLTEEDVSRK